MNTTFSASFTLMNCQHTFLDAYSDHCAFVRAEDLKGIFPDADSYEIEIEGSNNELDNKVTDFFSFSFDNVHPNDCGGYIDVLTKEFRCYLRFDGWWDIFVPVQFVKHINMVQPF
jgi:hypothetical protein